jgi:hypothetical protein
MSHLDITEYKMYVSYSDIIEAIKPWGTVEAVMMSPKILGVNHLFIVRFKESITITGKYGKGICTDSHGRLIDTPFFLRGMHSNGLAFYNIILSPSMIGFDITNLTMVADLDPQPDICQTSKSISPNNSSDGLHSEALTASLKLSSDKRSRPYIEKSWSENLKKEIESRSAREEKAAKILKWITTSGEAFLKRGISVSSLVEPSFKRVMGKWTGEIPTDDIVLNYKENNWNAIQLSL